MSYETKPVPYSWQRPRGLGSPSISEPVLSPHSSDIHLCALCWLSNYNAHASEAERDVVSFMSEPACLSGCVVRAARPWRTRTLLWQGHGSGICPGAGLGEVLLCSGVHGVLLAHRAPSWSFGAVPYEPKATPGCSPTGTHQAQGTKSQRARAGRCQTLC